MRGDPVPWPDPATRPAQFRSFRDGLVDLAVGLSAFGVVWALWMGLRACGWAPGEKWLVAAVIGASLLARAAARRVGFLPPRRRAFRPRAAMAAGDRRTAWTRLADPGGGSALWLLALGGTIAVLAKGDVGAAFIVGGGMGLAGALLIVRHFWLGGVEVRWDPGTLAPGKRAGFLVATTEGSPRLLGARFLLRRVGPDRSGTFRAPDPPHLRLVSLWQSEVRLAEPLVPGPGEFVRVEFEVPADTVPMGVLYALPVTWEFLVHGRSTWGALTEVFDVPFAAAPAAASRPEAPAAA